MGEMERLALLRAGALRLVGRQRARKLRRRGERVYWDPDLGRLVWEPKAPTGGKK